MVTQVVQRIVTPSDTYKGRCLYLLAEIKAIDLSIPLFIAEIKAIDLPLNRIEQSRNTDFIIFFF